jgi:hypothetical protein
LIRTTNIELTGDRYNANQLSLAHTNRLLYIFRNFNSFRELKINTHLEPFYDDTGKFVGSIHLSTNYGIEVVTVNVPFGEEEEKVKKVQTEKLVPCFIVTGGDGETRKVVGYIACTDGTFLEPYKWFDVVEGADIVLESFYDEGDKYYDGEVALDDKEVLSINGEDTLLFVRQTGLSPAEDRESEGPITEIDTQNSTCSSYEFVIGEDSWWAWYFAMSLATRGGGSRTGWYMQFDGNAIFKNNWVETTNSGTDYVSVDERICVVSEGPCRDDAEEWMAVFSLPVPCEYTDGDVNSFDRYQQVETEQGTFINNTAHRSLKLNNTIDSSVYIYELYLQSKTLHSWLTRDTPTYPGEWGLISDDTEDEVTITFTRDLRISVDGAEQSLSSVFGWGSARKYDGRGELDILYHKPSDVSTPTTLATVRSGPDDGSLIDMGLVYTGPGADGFQGSTQYHLQNIGGDSYIELPDVAGAPDDLDYRVRGHIILGVLKTTKTVKVL